MFCVKVIHRRRSLENTGRAGIFRGFNLLQILSSMLQILSSIATYFILDSYIFYKWCSYILYPIENKGV